MEELDIKPLESKVDELIGLCEALMRENKALREEQAVWRAERAKLIERNELAKSKIDAMIGRLRSLDGPVSEARGGDARNDGPDGGVESQPGVLGG